jgi:hypothetical protein
MPHWAVQQILVLIAPNSQIVMFITVAIDFLVQPKGHARTALSGGCKAGVILSADAKVPTEVLAALPADSEFFREGEVSESLLSGHLTSSAS